MARIPWRFDDPVLGTSQYMEINPDAGASPAYAKTLAKETTTAPGGARKTLLYEGADVARQFDFSGVILYETQFNFLYTAWDKRHPVLLTDDLGRTHQIYIESFTPTRLRSAQHPWRHTYQCSAVVIQ